ncbi:MAG TPA: B12-binding domain-containing protein [Anaerolineales bacterium]|nr:B12-binding domain-containing protein [Anaerolineales bacterium]
MYKEIYQIIIDGEMANIQDRVKNALEAGVVADAFLNQGMIDAMQEGGRLFKKSDCFFLSC